MDRYFCGYSYWSYCWFICRGLDRRGGCHLDICSGRARYGNRGSRRRSWIQKTRARSKRPGFEPGGLNPFLVRSEIWQTLAAHRNLVEMQALSWHLPLLLGNTEYAIAQLRILETCGDADMPQEDLIEMTMTLVNVNRSMEVLDEAIPVKIEKLFK